MGKIKPKNSKKTFKAFVASANDCEELRRATQSAIDEVNASLSQANGSIDVYAWEEKKRAEFIKPGESYQDKIFNEFGKHCDIFIIFFWTKLGAGTIEEYKFFKDQFVNTNPDILFLGCHYGKLIPHEVLEGHKSYYDLIDFLNTNDKDWAPLGRVRRSIKNKNHFAKELRVEITNYLTRKK